MPPIRIVIPATNLNPNLVQCLKAAQAEAVLLGAEIILAVNGDWSDCWQQIHTLIPGIQIRFQNYKRSAALTRNLGAEGFVEGILIFVDADVVVHQNAFKELVNSIEQQEAAAAVGCYTTDPNSRSFANKYKQLYLTTVYTRRDGEILNEFWSALGAIRAEVFHQLGGFDEAIPGAGGEDTVLGYKLTHSGFKIVASSQAQGVHLRRFSVGSIILNDFRKGLLTVRNSILHKVPLTSNRHATRRDVAAVTCAVLFALAMAVSWLTGWYLLVVSAVILSLWLMLRSDLLTAFFRNGVLFGLRSLIFLWVLDLVRAVVVLLAALGTGARIALSTLGIRSALALRAINHLHSLMPLQLFFLSF